MKKRILSFLLATVILVTPVFKPADMSFLTSIRTNSYSAGKYIGNRVQVNVDVSKIINSLKYKF